VRLPAAIAREARLLTPPRPSAAWVPDRGEVIWIDHNPQAGREIKEHHPFLVLSTAPFHRLPAQASSTSASTAATSPSLR
jgi:mRNA-degrading endonuclease toxin of MazEF toxin-antitoxin module